MTSVSELDFEGDGAPQEPQGDTALVNLGLISTLGNEALELQRQIDDHAAKSKKLGFRLTAILEKELPDLFTSVGVEMVKLSSGEKVSISDFVRGSIPKGKAPEACAWLRENGHGGMIRRDISVPFGPGDDELAEKVRKSLEEMKLPVQDEQTVHHSTLASWAREMTKKGETFPADLLGLFIGRKATIK